MQDNFDLRFFHSNTYPELVDLKPNGKQPSIISRTQWAYAILLASITSSSIFCYSHFATLSMWVITAVFIIIVLSSLHIARAGFRFLSRHVVLIFQGELTQDQVQRIQNILHENQPTNGAK